MKKRIIPIVILVLLVAVAGLVFWGQHVQETEADYYSGTIEGTEANLAFQVSGRVQEVLVDEGETVTQGQVLASLEKKEFIARRNEAVASAQALAFRLKELESGYRPREVEKARLACEEARANMEEAKRDKDRFDRLYERHIVSKRDQEDKDLIFITALKKFGMAKEAYELAKEGYRTETIETVRAQVESAEASLSLAEIYLQHTELKAPFHGIVTSRNVEPGEVVSPGREVLSVTDLSKVDLKIFVDETSIGNVKPGQRAVVKIDTFPGKTYNGNVSFISPEGEFTPKIIQTHKERVKLVYLVKVTIPNPDLELKPGMPADAWLQ